jgi:hypothetical protein
LHAGVGTRPIRELHVRIEHLEASPKLRKRRLELPLVEQRNAERRVRPDGVDDPDAQFYENYACGSDRNYTGYCNARLDTTRGWGRSSRSAKQQ